MMKVRTKPQVFEAFQSSPNDRGISLNTIP